ncbi:hypothetical protein [Microcoleus sp.]|uniref:hypothetical protein n=1 Tax=Microcoleus sp. TaxID=44472 RepID=UPI003524248C
MNPLSLKVDIFVIIGVIAALIPIWSYLDKILTQVKQNAIDRAMLVARLEFYEQRLEKIEEMIARNSGFKL